MDDILNAVLESAQDLHNIGLMSADKLREFEAICTEPLRGAASVAGNAVSVPGNFPPG